MQRGWGPGVLRGDWISCGQNDPLHESTRAEIIRLDQTSREPELERGEWILSPFSSSLHKSSLFAVDV